MIRRTLGYLAIGIGLTLALLILPFLLIRLLFLSLVIGLIFQLAKRIRRQNDLKFHHAFARQWQNMSSAEREEFMEKNSHSEMAFPKLKEKSKPCRNYNDQFIIY